MKEQPLSIRLDGELRKALEKLAKHEMRTLSDYVRLTLHRHVQDLYRANGEIFQEHTPSRKKVKQ
jgi:predicted DNA-binding protein